MSWCDRRALIASALALAACGFRPAYAPGGSGAALDGRVAVAQAGGDVGFAMARKLEDRLGPAPAPRYRLTYDVSTNSERVAVTTAQTTRRFNLIGRSSYTLIDARTGDTVTTGNVDGFAGYSAAGTTVATDAARQDGFERLATILADRIVAALIAAPELAP